LRVRLVTIVQRANTVQKPDVHSPTGNS
jgi:hypothetical protein